MIKILHTSDLHIGKRLHQAELSEDQSLFFAWLTDLIEKEKINALIVSGDIFDVANPSSESRKTYFELLVSLSRLKCKVIITAGNHDSPAVLEAPKELLKELDIHVIGGLPEDLSELLIAVNRADMKPGVVIAAIPYLRESDLRKYSENETSHDRAEALKSGIIEVFSDVAEKCSIAFPDLPAVAMGHLYIQDLGISESEREIQIGNMAGIEDEKLPDYFSYYALGHLHKPQQSGHNGKVTYCGAPVKMSFSESENSNRVMLITIEDKNVTEESIAVPLNRSLIRLTGTVEELKHKLKDLHISTNLLKTFIDLNAIEENPDPAQRIELEALIEEFKNDTAVILNYRLHLNNQPAGTANLYNIDVNIEDLKPLDVFTKKIENENLNEETGRLLKEAFNELLDEVMQMEEEK